MKKLGFGCMRFPEKDGNIEYDKVCKMFDAFMAAGFTYFDTAHGYMGEKSEAAVRECLTKRYKREDYILTDKLTSNYFEKEEDIYPFVLSQLKETGVEYFDYYLMHALSSENYQKYVSCNAFEVAKKLKSEGKIKHIGISFHDTAEMLDRILNEQPCIEVVQIQFNYLDYDDPGVQSYKCYKVCEKHNKPVIVMEPVKGGSLVNLTAESKSVLDKIGSGSYASYAIRFAASFENVFMVLSGMSSIDQVEDNVSYMKDFVPFIDEEYEAVKKVRSIIRNEDLIPCTACHYCTDGCPKGIKIPEVIACYNAKKQRKDWNNEYYYGIHTTDSGKASDCIKCGKCEKVCPQHLKIRDLLCDIASAFEQQN